MLTGARTSEVSPPGLELGRIRRVTSTHGRSIVTVDAVGGQRDLLVPAEPDRAAAAVATAGLWRLQWVQVHLDAPVPFARLAGTTRHPHLRVVTLAAALSLAEQGVPAYVAGEGD